MQNLETNITGGLFLAAAAMLYFGWILLPAKIGSILGLGPVTLSDLDWVGEPGVITGFSFNTTIPGINASRLSFTDNSFSANFDGLSISAAQFLQVDLQVNHASIPEPTTMLLLGTGLVGVASAARRRKKNQA